MRNSVAVAVCTVFLLTPGMASAQDAKPSTPSAARASTQSGSAMSMDSRMSQMEQHMQRMQALHERMTNASTPEERQKVMEEQRNEMQSGMAMMNQTMQGGGMMGGAGSGMMAHKGEPADVNAQMEMMHKRMDMMQMMMQTMMDQQGGMAGAGNRGGAARQ